MRYISSILVTGGSGFIGSAFIRYLLGPARFTGNIINLDLLTYAGNKKNLESVCQDPHYYFYQGDISDQALIKTIIEKHQVDLVVHFAAESHVDRSIFSPLNFAQTNVMGTLAILETLKNYPDIHFHHVSTDEVFGSLGQDGHFKETDPYKPNSPYSASKAASDHFVRAYHKTYQLSTTVSNCSNNYGPFQFPEKLIPLVILKCIKKETIPIYGQGSNIRDWLHVDDHVACIWKIVSQAQSGSYYNIGGNEEWTNLNIVKKIISLFSQKQDVDIEVLNNLCQFVKDRPGHDFRYAIDSSKVSQDLDWSPHYNFEEGISQTIDWYLNNLAWVEHVSGASFQEWLNQNYQMR